MKFLRKLVSRIRGSLSFDELVQRGLTCGERVTINSGCLIDEGFVHLIKIGNDVTLAPRVTILAHDASTKHWLGYTKIGLVKIGNNVFVGSGSIILPGITVGDNVVIGAGSVVTKNIPDNCVAVGNSCTIVGSIYEYVAKQKVLMEKLPVFDESYTHYDGTRSGKVVPELKLLEQKQLLSENQGKGFVV